VARREQQNGNRNKDKKKEGPSQEIARKTLRSFPRRKVKIGRVFGGQIPKVRDRVGKRVEDEAEKGKKGRRG